MNMKKALEMNSISSNESYKVQQNKTGEMAPQKTPLEKTQTKRIERKEITISSEELDFL